MFLIFVRNILCPQQMFPRLRGMGTKQMFCVPLVCPPKKHHEQQCVRNNVSSFATTLTKLFLTYLSTGEEKDIFLSREVKYFFDAKGEMSSFFVVSSK